MAKFKIEATLDTCFETVIEAVDEDEAWQMAKDGNCDNWVQTDDGHEWTIEGGSVVEVAEDYEPTPVNSRK